MKILIVSMCKFKEHELEFVRPLLQILKKLKNYSIEIKKYYEKINFDLYDIIILSGTALLDFNYLNYIENFKSLKNTDKIVIGICAGLHVLAKIYSLNLKDFEIIGKKEIKLLDRNKIYSFFLTSKVIYDPKNFEVLGKYQNIPVFLRYKNTFLFAFHPEVLNQDMILKIVEKNNKN